MKTKLTAKEYLILASMLFGMFFGAGNLIFPASMGQLSGSSMWPAVLGFCVTGVGLPLLAIAAMGISSSEGLFDMSSKVGKGFGYFFTCALYLCIGPLFAIPRTSTVSFQVGVSPLVSESYRSIALFIFTLIFFAAALYFSLRPSGIMTWIGKILNPLFLIFLSILIFTAILRPMGSIYVSAPEGTYATHSFFTGFLEGYNTMDVLASLAFGIILIDSIRSLGVSDPKQISYSTIKSGVFSVLLMAVIYCALTYVGAQSRSVYGIDANGGDVLYHIASHYFGSFGGILLGITITCACLKTAIGLITSCSTTFVHLFPKTCSYRTYAIIFSIFSFAISNIGLSNIISYSLPALYFLYPLAITLILLCLFGHLYNYNRYVMVCTMTAAICAAVFDFIKALPEGVRAVIPGISTITAVSDMIPLSSIGMGWVIPTVVGLIIGLCLYLIKSKV